MNRRRLLSETARLAYGAGILGLALGLTAPRASSKPAQAIRPPGALPENAFLSACLRCGMCVRDCPYDTLRLAGFAEGIATGTPYFVARETPCEMCEDIPCVKACPSGSLDPNLTDIDDARMGVAVLVGQETCLNYLGMRCDVCYRVCPLIDEAITLDLRHNERTGRHARFIPTVHSDKCTGCGKCERSCVLDVSAIKVLPERLALGEHGRHYRLGLEEKDRQGEALVGDVTGPRGRDFDPAPGGGLPAPSLPERTPGGGFGEFRP